MKVVTLAPGKHVSLSTYARAWRTVKAAPPFQHFQDTGFDYGSESAESLLKRFRAGLHDRINKQMPGYGRGRKWSAGWQSETSRAAWRLNTPRLIVRETDVPVWLRDRFRDRLYTRDDF